MADQTHVSKLLTRNDLQNVLAHINLGDDSHTEITQAEFDALTEEEKNSGTIYFVSDGVAKNIFIDDNVPIGTIAQYGGKTDPSYWLICDGRAVSRDTYSELFAAIGTTYGTGDGSTTFNIPDLRGRVSVGASDSYTIGAKGGEATHTLTVDEMPSHTHAFTKGGTSININVTRDSETTHGFDWPTSGGLWGGLKKANTSIANTGGGKAHNNMQPYVVTNYIIKASTAISQRQSQLDFIYPVGSYYETSDANFNPNTAWGGTWVLEDGGRVHISSGTNIANTTSYWGSYPAGANTFPIGERGGEASHVLTVDQMPSHAHTPNNWVVVTNSNYASVGDRIPGGTDGAFSAKINAAANPDNYISNNTGGGLSHNNMQPYTVVNRWHRTA